ncbi:DMT family transporter [Paenibacillus pasadenensis]|uniref:Conserved membrane protein n=1 Tax=Paenibacillus pasadenensis TaxID=217090 RepID=A0A2N5N6I2_9BACL|nr:MULTISPECIES: DMT family transporter [Paenibacillus]PLT45958.1 conserved membrane protein [Paenibacillus pasadenensis]QGG56373.1 EamA-like transporter family protein [Paenibacillus sp. B01]
MTGIIWAVASGLLLSLQNLFNANVDRKAGMWTTTTLVLGMGFAAALLLGLAAEGAALFQLAGMEPWFAFSGLIGIGVVTCMVQGVKRLGPTFAVSLALCSQLAFAMLWDSMGWLGLERVPLEPTRLAGVLLLAAGIVVFKLGGRGRSKERVLPAAAEAGQDIA